MWCIKFYQILFITVNLWGGAGNLHKGAGNLHRRAGNIQIKRGRELAKRGGELVKRGGELMIGNFEKWGTDEDFFKRGICQTLLSRSIVSVLYGDLLSENFPQTFVWSFRQVYREKERERRFLLFQLSPYFFSPSPNILWGICIFRLTAIWLPFSIHANLYIFPTPLLDTFTNSEGVSWETRKIKVQTFSFSQFFLRLHRTGQLLGL